MRYELHAFKALVPLGIAPLLLAGQCFAANISAPLASSLSSPQKKTDTTTCSLQSTDRSDCAFHFAVSPPHIEVLTGTVVVNGAHMPTSVKKYILKNALHRPWSTNPKEKYLVVCRFNTAIGSHIPTLLECETNKTHIQQQRETRQNFGVSFHGSLGCASAPQVGSGMVPLSPVMESCIVAEVITWAHSHGPTKVLTGMSRLPPAGGSHTFGVKENGKVVSRWIFKKGRLVAVWHLPGYHESKKSNND